MNTRQFSSNEIVVGPDTAWTSAPFGLGPRLKLCGYMCVCLYLCCLHCHANYLICPLLKHKKQMLPGRLAPLKCD